MRKEITINILVACEFSGIVREAFRKYGHNAISCDLLPTEIPGPHYHGDVENILYHFWDMLIGFPPCTHLAVSGARWFPQKIANGRQQYGIDFFMKLANSNIPKICLENPIGIMSTQYRKPDQIIQPWQFGHQTTKATCLWLKNLPLLTPSCIVSKGARKFYPSGKSQSLLYSKTGKQSSKLRSITFKGVADAMAQQWS